MEGADSWGKAIAVIVTAAIPLCARKMTNGCVQVVLEYLIWLNAVVGVLNAILVPGNTAMMQALPIAKR